MHSSDSALMPTSPFPPFSHFPIFAHYSPIYIGECKNGNVCKIIFAQYRFYGNMQNMQNWANCPQTRFLEVIAAEICAKLERFFPIFAQCMCKINFAPFLHIRLPLNRHNQLLRKRISFDDIKPKLLPISLQKLKYRTSCISAIQLHCQIPYFCHGWGAGEGFDFVCEDAAPPGPAANRPMTKSKRPMTKRHEPHVRNKTPHDEIDLTAAA